MTLLLNQLFKLVKLLNSDTGATAIAIGVGLGVVLGLSPALSLQAILVFIAIFLFRVQMGAALLTASLVALIAWPLDPAFDAAGRFVLSQPALEGIFTALYNMPIVPLTQFNNTVVMGSGVVAIVLLPFVIVGTRLLVQRYREVVLARIREHRLYKAFRLPAVFKWYDTYDRHFG